MKQLIRQQSDQYELLKGDLQRSNGNKAEVEEKCLRMQDQIDQFLAEREVNKKAKAKNVEYVSKLRMYESESMELVNLNSWLNQRVQNLESQLAQKDL